MTLTGDAPTAFFDHYAAALFARGHASNPRPEGLPTAVLTLLAAQDA